MQLFAKISLHTYTHQPYIFGTVDLKICRCAFIRKVKFANLYLPALHYWRNRSEDLPVCIHSRREVSKSILIFANLSLPALITVTVKIENMYIFLDKSRARQGCLQKNPMKHILWHCPFESLNFCLKAWIVACNMRSLYGRALPQALRPRWVYQCQPEGRPPYGPEVRHKGKVFLAPTSRRMGGGAGQSPLPYH